MVSPIHHLGCFLPKSFPSRRLPPTRVCLCLVALNGERVSIHANPPNQALAHPTKQCCLVEQPLSPSSTNSRECDAALKYFAVLRSVLPRGKTATVFEERQLDSECCSPRASFACKHGQRHNSCITGCGRVLGLHGSFKDVLLRSPICVTLGYCLVFG